VLAALRLDAGRLPVPRADGDWEALRILLVARQEITVARTARIGRLRALLLAGDDTDRRAARTALTQTALPRWPGVNYAPAPATSRPSGTARSGAWRSRSARPGASCGTTAPSCWPSSMTLAPGLTSRYGIGPVSAAQAIVSFSHPGRCRSEAAYAALGGTSPIPASSGQTIRHRLNRGGDRALNRAIHAIAVLRMRDCPRTRAYVARRTAEGKTRREIRRCLKRYIARELCRHLTQSMNPPVGP
jgi:transposase